jgi:hypothetical protein
MRITGNQLSTGFTAIPENVPFRPGRATIRYPCLDFISPPPNHSADANAHRRFAGRDGFVPACPMHRAHPRRFVRAYEQRRFYWRGHGYHCVIHCPGRRFCRGRFLASKPSTNG